MNGYIGECDKKFQTWLSFHGTVVFKNYFDSLRRGGHNTSYREYAEKVYDHIRTLELVFKVNKGDSP